MPFEQDKAIKRPEVDVLPAMKAESFLVRRKSAQEAKLNIVVVAGNVGVGMVENAMLPVPHIGAAADHIDGPRHELVDPTDIGIGPVPGVVLNIEPDGGGSQGQHQGQWNGSQPTGRDKYQQDVTGKEPGQDEASLEIHAWAVTLELARCGKKRLDSSMEFGLEITVLGELGMYTRISQGARG